MEERERRFPFLDDFLWAPMLSPSSPLLPLPLEVGPRLHYISGERIELNRLNVRIKR